MVFGFLLFWHTILQKIIHEIFLHCILRPLIRRHALGKCARRIFFFFFNAHSFSGYILHTHTHLKGNCFRVSEEVAEKRPMMKTVLSWRRAGALPCKVMFWVISACAERQVSISTSFLFTATHVLMDSKKKKAFHQGVLMSSWPLLKIKQEREQGREKGSKNCSCHPSFTRPVHPAGLSVIEASQIKAPVRFAVCSSSARLRVLFRDLPQKRYFTTNVQCCVRLSVVLKIYKWRTQAEGSGNDGKQMDNPDSWNLRLPCLVLVP